MVWFSTLEYALEKKNSEKIKLFEVRLSLSFNLCREEVICKVQAVVDNF